jgi:flagellar basal-body rod protein FlgB
MRKSTARSSKLKRGKERKRCGTMDLITSLTTQVMGKALDGLSKRHTAIASNLANVDTPHYRRRDVSFEGALQHAIMESKGQMSGDGGPASNDSPLLMRATNPAHFSNGQAFSSVDDIQPEITQTKNMQYREDGNSVDIETEMTQLAKNTQRYVALTNLETRDFKSIRSIITGGGS